MGLAIYLIGTVYVRSVMWQWDIALPYPIDVVFILLWVFAPIIISLLSFLVATRSLKVFCAGLRAAIFPKADITEELREQAVSLFNLLTKITLLATVLGMALKAGQAILHTDLGSAVHVTLAAFMIIDDSATTLCFGLFLIIGVFKPVEFILKKHSSVKPTRDSD